MGQTILEALQFFGIHRDVGIGIQIPRLGERPKRQRRSQIHRTSLETNSTNDTSDQRRRRTCRRLVPLSRHATPLGIKHRTLLRVLEAQPRAQVSQLRKLPVWKPNQSTAPAIERTTEATEGFLSFLAMQSSRTPGRLKAIQSSASHTKHTSVDDSNENKKPDELATQSTLCLPIQAWIGTAHSKEQMEFQVSEEHISEEESFLQPVWVCCASTSLCSSSSPQ